MPPSHLPLISLSRVAQSHGDPLSGSTGPPGPSHGEPPSATGVTGCGPSHGEPATAVAVVAIPDIANRHKIALEVYPQSFLVTVISRAFLALSANR